MTAGAASAFRAEVAPPAETMARVESDTPANPFFSRAYALARNALGEIPCLFTGPADAEGEISFYGFLHRGRLGGFLEIPSMPAIAHPAAFGTALARFCAAHRVTEVDVNTFCSPPGPLPTLPGEVRRYARTEFVIDLDGERLLPSMAKGHRQPIRSAERAGLVLRRSTSEAACAEHVFVMGASMTRREERGESVSTGFPIEPILALVRTGAGELFQVVDGDRVLSSMLLLRSRLVAYDHTSGSSPEGMAAGAPKYAVFRACQELRNEGCAMMNLGGVRESEVGLRNFKEHFGARPVALQAASAEFSTPAVRLARGAARLLRRVPWTRSSGA